MASCRLSRKAADDLDTIYTYTIEQHGLAQAKEYLNLLQGCFEKLADLSGLGRRADRIAPSVRRHECQAQVVFYLPKRREYTSCVFCMGGWTCLSDMVNSVPSTR